MKSEVAVLKTEPSRVLEDYARLLTMAGCGETLDRSLTTLLKINISWHQFYPACSTTPWQLEGVVGALLSEGFSKERIMGAHNRTVVVSDRVGEKNNRLKGVLEKYGIGRIFLNEPEAEWVPFEPRARMRVLHNIFPGGIHVPKAFFGTNIVQLPTMKTHVFTTITGAMKNAFGGLLNERRHWTHSVIHETLIDLLAIQKEIHAGLFAVMDGTFVGSGPGPRCMVPHVKDFILASADQVAIDAVSAKMMGFDPLTIDFIRLGHEAGLGCGDPREIRIVGEDISGVNFRFKRDENTLASLGQKAIYHGPLKPFEKLLLQTFIVPWSYVASRLYHDVFWYPFVGKRRVRKWAFRTKWGKLFLRYEDS